jgi:hypothetical protein
MFDGLKESCFNGYLQSQTVEKLQSWRSLNEILVFLPFCRRFFHTVFWIMKPGGDVTASLHGVTTQKTTTMNLYCCENLKSHKISFRC